MKSKKILALVIAATTVIATSPLASAHAATLTATTATVIAMPDASIYNDGTLGEIQYSDRDYWGISGSNNVYIGNGWAESSSSDNDTLSYYALMANVGDQVSFSYSYSDTKNTRQFSMSLGGLGFKSLASKNTVGSVSFVMPANAGNDQIVVWEPDGDRDYYKLIPITPVVAGNLSSDSAVQVQQALLNYKGSNSTSINDLQNLASSVIDTSRYSVSVSQTDKLAATESSDGYLVGNATVTDSKTGQQTTTTFMIQISKLGQSLSTIATSLSNFCKNYSATNSSNSSDFVNAVKITNPAYSVSVSGWLLTPATDTTTGKLTCNVNILQNGTAVQTIAVSKTVNELPTTTATAKSVISGIMDNYVATNESDKDSLLASLKKAVGNNINLTIPNWNLEPSSEIADGSLVASIGITDSITSDSVSVYKDIQAQEQSVGTVKSLYESALTNLKTSNDTTADDLKKLVLITNDKITANVSDFNLTPANETKHGTITANITITNSSTGETEVVPVNLQIDQLQESVDTIKSLFESKLENFVATNATTDSDLIGLVYTGNNENIDVSMDDFSIRYANDQAKGAVTGTIKIEDTSTGKIDEVPVNKEINLLSQGLSTAIKDVQNVVNTYQATNSSTFDDLLIKCNDVVSQNIDVYYKVNGQLDKVDSDENNTGSMSGTIEITDGTDTVELPFDIIISKTPQTLSGAQTVIQACLNNFEASNSTTDQDVINAINTTIRSDSIKATFGTDEGEPFNKTLATQYKAGLITGSINVTDGTSTIKVPVNLKIAQLAQSIGEAQQAINTEMPNFVVSNDTTDNDIKSQIQDVVSSNIYVTMKGDFTKTKATIGSTGEIKTTAILVDKNSGNSAEVPLDLTISKLTQTLDEATSSLDALMPSFIVSNDTTADDIKNQIQAVVASNINIEVNDFDKTDATINTNGKITATAVLEDENGNSKEVPLDLTIIKLKQTIDEATNSLDAAMPNFVVSNDTTADNLKNQVQAVVASNITVKIDDFDKTDATLSAAGEIKATVVLKDQDGNTKQIPLDLSIQQLQQSLGDAETAVENQLGNTTGSNSTTASDLQDQLGNVVGGNITVTVGDDFNNQNATSTTSGLITGTVTITDTETGKSVTVPISITIPKLSNGSAGGSGGSGGGGGGGSSSNDSSTDNISIPTQSTTVTENQGGSSTGWRQDDKGIWHYYDSNGKMVTGWIQINGLWYYFNSNGNLVTGWFQWQGCWYYLNEQPGLTLGAMQIGWAQWNGNWYYLNPAEGGPQGSMETGWVQWNSNWYYLSSDGAMKTGWLNYNGTWYYMASNGNMGTGWFRDTDGNWYYLNQDGSMLTGWFQDTDGTWYYLQSNGVMAYDTTIDGYYLDSTGAWVQ